MENSCEKKKQGMIQDDLEARNAAFLKLKSEIFEEAIELSILCGAELAIFLTSPSGEIHCFANPSADAIIKRYTSTNTDTIIKKEGDSPSCSSMSHSQTLTDCDKNKQRDLDAQVEAEKSLTLAHLAVAGAPLNVRSISLSFASSHGAVSNCKSFNRVFVLIPSKASNTNSMSWSTSNIEDIYVFASIAQRDAIITGAYVGVGDSDLI
ncbi:agamous-like MADS-box protein AGL62 [Senna tora]|uniref:Agamous-like MADS-box protein AGL62 n=1 Tax=Senna tora TaxID=362788 RepID=A0A834WXC1_9FABA|nr:agamous-like MADS-box protein AGL62 [Senna tora]